MQIKLEKKKNAKNYSNKTAVYPCHGSGVLHFTKPSNLVAVLLTRRIHVIVASSDLLRTTQRTAQTLWIYLSLWI